MDDPWTNRIVPTVFAGSRAYFSNRNSFTPPSLVVQCSSLFTAAAGLIISFITHLYWTGHVSRQLMGGIWLALMTFAHLATCLSINTLKSVCVIVIGVAPVFSQASLISGRDAILVISRLSLSTIGCGVPAGAMKPTQRVALKPATPASAIVGTSGRIGDRVFPVVPRARTRPALIIGAMVGTESNSIWICPLRMSFRAPVEPL